MRVPPLVDAVLVHLSRFVLMFVVSELAVLAGLRGFAIGLTVNAVVTAYAVVLMTRRRLWRSTGALTRWRSWLALAAVLPLAFEAVTWALPAGLAEQSPGFALWALTLLLVGVNEELFSRGVVLSRLRAAYSPLTAVALTGALFGLQHLSAFALSSRSAGDVLGNVGLSAVVGFAYAAFQYRFRWIWPLMLIHATADFTTILAARPLPDAVDRRRARRPVRLRPFPPPHPAGTATTLLVVLVREGAASVAYGAHDRREVGTCGRRLPLAPLTGRTAAPGSPGSRSSTPYCGRSRRSERPCVAALRLPAG